MEEEDDSVIGVRKYFDKILQLQGIWNAILIARRIFIVVILIEVGIEANCLDELLRWGMIMVS